MLMMEHEVLKREPSPIEEPVIFPSQLSQGFNQQVPLSHPNDGTYTHSATTGVDRVPAEFAGVPHSQYGHTDYPTHTDLDVIPAEFTRIQTGESILDSSAVWYENGRSYHSYKEGKYLLPNDGVRYCGTVHGGIV
jgi:hypothetical protein